MDALVRERFAALPGAAADGTLDHWLATRAGGWAGFSPAISSRGTCSRTADAFAFDTLALSAARAGIAAGADSALGCDERAFFYLPFEHSSRCSTSTPPWGCSRRCTEAAPAGRRQLTSAGWDTHDSTATDPALQPLSPSQRRARPRLDGGGARLPGARTDLRSGLSSAPVEGHQGRPRAAGVRDSRPPSGSSPRPPAPGPLRRRRTAASDWGRPARPARPAAARRRRRTARALLLEEREILGAGDRLARRTFAAP